MPVHLCREVGIRGGGDQEAMDRFPCLLASRAPSLTIIIIDEAATFSIEFNDF